MNIPSTARCPNCGQVLTRVMGGHTSIVVVGGTERHGITYSCPSCQVCLGVQMDPIALKNDTVQQILDGLRNPK